MANAICWYNLWQRSKTSVMHHSVLPAKKDQLFSITLFIAFDVSDKRLSDIRALWWFRELSPKLNLQPQTHHGGTHGHSVIHHTGTTDDWSKRVKFGDVSNREPTNHVWANTFRIKNKYFKMENVENGSFCAGLQKGVWPARWPYLVCNHPSKKTSTDWTWLRKHLWAKYMC